jgi:hypothetical protein
MSIKDLERREATTRKRLDAAIERLNAAKKELEAAKENWKLTNIEHAQASAELSVAKAMAQPGESAKEGRP